jgi:hypothetical protein
LCELYYSTTMQLQFGRTRVIYLGYLMMCYLVFYVGLNRLLMLLVRRQMPSPMLGAFALMVVTMLLAHLLPLITAFYLNGYREFDYGWHQAFNLFWTCSAVGNNLTGEIEMSTIIITLAAIVVFGLNLVMSTRDVMLVRVAEPPRGHLEPSEAETVKINDPFAD